VLSLVVPGALTATKSTTAMSLKKTDAWPQSEISLALSIIYAGNNILDKID
jgi:hypothetical protein